MVKECIIDAQRGIGDESPWEVGLIKDVGIIKIKGILGFI